MSVGVAGLRLRPRLWLEVWLQLEVRLRLRLGLRLEARLRSRLGLWVWLCHREDEVWRDESAGACSGQALAADAAVGQVDPQAHRARRCRLRVVDAVTSHHG